MAVTKKSKKKTKKKNPSKKKVSKKKQISPQEQRLDIVEAYLQEIFHLVAHSVDAGTESDTPLHEIMSALIAVHNAQDNSGHNIRGITIQCECEAKQHSLEIKEYVHDCQH